MFGLETWLQVRGQVTGVLVGGTVVDVAVSTGVVEVGLAGTGVWEVVAV